jgi:multiple antibiotic resistance protein
LKVWEIGILLDFVFLEFGISSLSGLGFRYSCLGFEIRNTPRIPFYSRNYLNFVCSNEKTPPMHEMILFTGTVLMGFFAIMNPIANTPIFMGITADIPDRKQKNLIAFKSTFFAFIIVAAFTILGQLIFKMFGITLPAFQITGGILLFFIGYDLLQGKSSSFHHPSTQVHEELQKKAADPDSATSIALTPLAIPILAGPGTIATAMNFVGMKTSLGHIEHLAVVIVAFALMCLITFVMFISANRIVDFLGKHIINVISRIMGLLLAVIATQMVISGIKNAIEMY